MNDGYFYFLLGFLVFGRLGLVVAWLVDGLQRSSILVGS